MAGCQADDGYFISGSSFVSLTDCGCSRDGFYYLVCFYLKIVFYLINDKRLKSIYLCSEKFVGKLFYIFDALKKPTFKKIKKIF